MNVFKSILLTAVLSLLSFPMLAQGPGGPRGPHPEQLKESLDLSDEQMEALKPIFELTRSQMSALREKEFENRADRRLAAREIMEGQKEKMATILTETQLEKLEEMRPKRGPMAGPGPRPDQNEELHQALKAYQEANVEPVLRKQRAKLEADLSAEDKATLAALREKREAHRAMMRKAKESDARPAEPTEAQREEHKKNRAEVKGLVEKYNTEIEALLAEVQGQADQWEKDIKAIHEKYRPEDAPKPQNKGERGKAGPKADKAMRKAHFLLMNPA